MRARDYVLERDADMGISGTLIYNLDFTDPITEIILEFKGQNHNAGNLDNPLEACVSKIEITDGGQVLWDCPGDVALAAYATFKGDMPRGYRTGAGSDTQIQCIPILFGRHPYDPMFAFNPIAHRNPQLKVTFDEAALQAAGSGGFISDTWTLSIIVRLMEEAPAPTGFLALREIEEFTSLGSGDTKTEMPTDRVIRAIITRVYETLVSWSTNITNFKLSGDGGKFVPFDLDAGEMLDVMVESFKQVCVDNYTVNNKNSRRQTWVGSPTDSNAHTHSGAYMSTANSPSGSSMEMITYLHDGVAANMRPIHFSVTGWAIHNTLIYLFGRQDVPEDWFRASDYRKLDYVLTNGQIAAEVNVAVQQVYPY